MKRRRIRHIDLALQGGGAHGAFTWGVLDRLLEDERIEIDGISGTSAGAMNAVVLADGLAADGRRGAREALRRFWREVSNASSINPLTNPLGALFAGWASDASPFQPYMNLMSQLWSPSQFNPLNLNPLRDISSAGRLRAVARAAEGALFVSATNVRTGRVARVPHHELTADAVMASACLPLLFRAVEIDGEAYWDGGYVGNPSLLPLIAESPAHDLVLVQINPARRDEVPTRAGDRRPHQRDHVQQQPGQGTALGRAAEAAAAAEGAAEGGPHGHLFRAGRRAAVHRIDAEAELAQLGASTKLTPQWPFVSRLHGIGRDAAGDWLREELHALGRRSTVARP
jgi:NTE family protein